MKAEKVGQQGEMSDFVEKVDDTMDRNLNL
jgi:hypothetical protein